MKIAYIFGGVFLPSFIFMNMAFCESTSEVEFFDSTGTNSTVKFGWKGNSSDGNFYIKDKDEAGIELKQGNMTVDGAVNATSFSGDGRSLTNLPPQTETDPSVPNELKDGISWEEVSGKPTTIGDITGITTGTGLMGGATSGTATLKVDFESVATAGHNHSGTYAPLGFGTFTNWTRMFPTPNDVTALYAISKYDSKSGLATGTFQLDNTTGTVLATSHLGYVNNGTIWAGYFYGANVYIQKDLHIGGTVVNLSDKRLKQNIEKIENPLDKVLNLNGVIYQWNRTKTITENFSKDKQVGLIAQDVQKVLPESVKKNDEGYLMVSYTDIIPVLVEAIKEQNKKIEKQALELEEIKSLIQQLYATK